MAEKAMRRRAVGAAYRSGADTPETIYGKQWLLESADRIRETCQLPQFDVETASRERARVASTNNI
jgi:hypothetical protein